MSKIVSGNNKCYKEYKISTTEGAALIIWSRKVSDEMTFEFILHIYKLYI